MSKATNRQKDKLPELADKQMLLSSIDYFVGRERGMHKMLTYARHQIEKLLLNQRKQAVDAINKATSDIQQQYDKALHRRTKQITATHITDNPHNRQFPIYRGTDNADVDDGSTGELEDVYGEMPILLSRFSKLPITSILQDMLNKLHVSPPKVTPPVLTFPNPDTMLADITKADIDTVLG